VSAFCPHTCAKTSTPLVNCTVNDGQVNDGQVNDGQVNDGQVNDGQVNDGQVNATSNMQKMLFQLTTLL